MNSKPKLLFVYDHPKPEWWLDGLSQAINVLEEDFEVKRFNFSEHQITPDALKHEFVLGWGGFNSRIDRWLQETVAKKKGLCIAGNAFPPDGCLNYDVLFYETKWYRPQINHHPNIVQAFGVNTDIFYPFDDVPTALIYDYIGVGAFANWKRWEKLIDKPGRKMVVGQYQTQDMQSSEESMYLVNQLMRGGVACSPMVNPFDLAMLYHSSRTLYMPSDVYGGGERSVLEARVCGLQVEIEDDNPKLRELVEMFSIPNHFDYAKQLKKGILSVL